MMWQMQQMQQMQQLQQLQQMQQMQMAGLLPNFPMMAPPPNACMPAMMPGFMPVLQVPVGCPVAPPPAAAAAPSQATTHQLCVRVEGLTFDYQLTDDDVLKVFSRYGEVSHVLVNADGTSAVVRFEQPQKAIQAQRDLDGKELVGMSGALLRVSVEVVLLHSVPTLPVQQHHPGGYAPCPPMAPPMPCNTGHQVVGPAVAITQEGTSAALLAAPAAARPGGKRKKHICKIEIGIENDNEFRVASRVINIARQIWRDPSFQEFDGKTRLRGKGVGGPYEADEPLALIVSCKNEAGFDLAIAKAEQGLQKLHQEYRLWREQRGLEALELEVKVYKRAPLADSAVGTEPTASAISLTAPTSAAPTPPPEAAPPPPAAEPPAEPVEPPVAAPPPPDDAADGRIGDIGSA